MMWLRRSWVVVRTYWLAYVIVAIVGVLFVSQGEWIYVVVWAAMLAVITAILAIVLAHEEVSWEAVTAGVDTTSGLPRSGEVYGCVLAGTYEKHLLRIVSGDSSLGYRVRMRSVDVLRWRELGVTGVTGEDLLSLIRDGTVGLISERDLTRNLRRTYFRGDRARPDQEVDILELRR